MNDVLVPTVLDDLLDFTVIANSPKEMETAQRSLILWAARKIQAIKNDIAEAVEQHRIAKERRWDAKAWQREVAKHEKRAEFYRKVKTALEAGYYIVPPFPIDVFAIRTDRIRPRRQDSTYSDNHDQGAAILPAGEGRYVDPKPVRDSYVDHEMRVVNHQTGEKKQVPVTYYYASEFDEVEFPFRLARAEIKDSTLKAMSLKVFDQLGVLPRVRKPDPIVCGRILFPKQQPYGRRPENQEGLTFFVTWWLDTKTIKV